MRGLVAAVALLVTAASIECRGAERSEMPFDACVLICNQTPCCSGTLFSVGKKWARGISCSHCFSGKIGGEFSIVFPDGRKAPAYLTRWSQKPDFALFRVPAEHVHEVAQVAVRQSSSAAYEICGYPGPGWTRPLNRYRVSPRPMSLVNAKRANESAGRTRWAFNVWGQAIAGGCSGGGLFANGQLVGVESDDDTQTAGVAYTSTHDQLLAFLEENCNGDEEDFGQWRAQPLSLAERPAPASGTFIVAGPVGPPGTGNCADGHCRLRSSAAAEPIAGRALDAPPAPDDGEASRGQAPRHVDHDQIAASEIYSGRGRKPADLDTTKKRTHVIDVSRHELEAVHEAAGELEARIAALERQGVKHGRDGKDGRDGRDGKDGKDAVQKIIAAVKADEKDGGHPLLALIAFPTSCLLCLGVWLLVRARNANSNSAQS